VNRRAARGVLLAEAVWGVALVSAPRPVIRWVNASASDPPEVVAARVLGARHVVQAALIFARPSRARILVGSAISGVHAASMLLLGTVDAPRRRLAACDAAIAGAWCVSGLLLAS
jgi:hypothetical protein